MKQVVIGSIAVLSFMLIMMDSTAQDRFNIRYATEFGTWFGNAEENSDGNYVVAGRVIIDQFKRAGLWVFDGSGEILNDQEIGLPDLYSWCDFNGERYFDNNDLIICGYGTTFGPNEGMLVRFNFDTQEWNVFSFFGPDPDNPFTITSDAFYDNAENLYLSAQISNEDEGNHFMIRKYDNNEELDWEYIYATEGGNDINLALHPYLDGVLIFPSGLVDEADPTNCSIQFLNDAGLVWEITDDEIGLDIVSVSDMILDGEMLIAADEIPNGLELEWKPSLVGINLVTLDSWEVELHNEFGGFNSSKEVVMATDSGYVVACEVSIYDNLIDSIDGTYNEMVTLSKVFPNGELDWQRSYDIVESTSDGHYVSSLTACSDGGYLFAGAASGFTGDDPDEILQQGWLVKVDEFGCLVEDCHVGVNEQKPDAVQYFLVGPNPVSRAQGSLNVFLKELPYSPNRNIEIHDLNGKLLESFNTPQGGTTYMLDVSSWAAGVVVVSLMEGGQVLGVERVIVE